ncbi:hypothetical protein ACHAXN_000616 [Cyclotella atomus]
MEEDQPIQPDESGHLDLKYRSWMEVPFADLTSFAYCLQSLSRCLHSLTDELSSLRFLQILNCSCNKLQSPPESIGALESLTVLKAMVTNLPPFQVALVNIEGCSSLQKLLVQNYDLSWLPLSLAKLKDTLSEIDLSNNNEQLAVTIPTEGLKHEFKTLQHDIVGYEFDLLQLEEQVAMLEQKKLNVENDLDQVRHFLRARECKRHIQCWVEQKWEEIKLACASKLPV